MKVCRVCWNRLVDADDVRLGRPDFRFSSDEIRGLGGGGGGVVYVHRTVCESESSATKYFGLVESTVHS